MTYYAIERILGLDDVRARLEREGIRTTRQVLLEAATPAQRAALARRIGATEEDVLQVFQISDLLRVRHVGPAYAALLLDAGVTSAKALAAADPVALLAALTTAKERCSSVERAPTAKEIPKWIASAKTLRLPGV
jgi:predicted flap endonuclease-1-like 5' DNA nuclease